MSRKVGFIVSTNPKFKYTKKYFCFIKFFLFRLILLEKYEYIF